jgi:hypothetical protein
MNDDGSYAGPRMCKEFDEYQKARHFHLWHVVGGEAENMCSVKVFRLWGPTGATLTIPSAKVLQVRGRGWRSEAVEANSKRGECSPELVSRGDLRRCDAAAGDASRKTMCAPVSDLQTMKHLLADDRCNDATENRESGGKATIMAVP